MRGRNIILIRLPHPLPLDLLLPLVLQGLVPRHGIVFGSALDYGLLLQLGLVDTLGYQRLLVGRNGLVAFVVYVHVRRRVLAYYVLHGLRDVVSTRAYVQLQHVLGVPMQHAFVPYFRPRLAVRRWVRRHSGRSCGERRLQSWLPMGL